MKKQVLWKDFLDPEKKIAITCQTEKESDELLKLLHDKGVKWWYGNSLLDRNVFSEYKDRACYHYGKEVNDIGLLCYDINFAKAQNYTVYNYSEIELVDKIEKECNKMNDFQIFENPSFGKIRTMEKDGQVWFVGKDIAGALGYSNPSKTLKDHVDKEDKDITKCYTLGGNQNTTIINESGFYALVLSSKLPTAKQFKRWVTNEVLPTIRKTGGYIPVTEEMSDSEIMAKALLVAQKISEEKQRKIEEQEKTLIEQKPLVEFAKKFLKVQTVLILEHLQKY